MNYYADRDKNRERARQITDFMRDHFKEEISDRVSRTKTYELLGKDVIPKSDKPIHGIDLKVINSDSVSAIFDIPNGDLRIGVLNFASYTNPGGKFLMGSSAQEEALCHSSYLFNVLREQDKYYYWNRKNKNNNLYLHRALYSPEIRFFRKDEDKLCDVITCAAPNLRHHFNLTDSEYRELLIKRMSLVKWIAEDNNIDVLILGAWGCGVFQNIPEVVAQCFKEVLSESTSIMFCVYAIPDKDSIGEANKEAFEKFLL